MYSLTPAPDHRAQTKRFCGCATCSDRGRLISWGGPARQLSAHHKLLQNGASLSSEHSLGRQDCILQTRAPVPGAVVHLAAAPVHLKHHGGCTAVLKQGTASLE